MNFDPGEVLSYAWQITWKHRVLWLIGILSGFLVSIMFPVLFSPTLFHTFLQNSKIDLRFALLFMGVYTLALYPIRARVQTSVRADVLKTTEDSKRISATYLRFMGSPKMQPLLSTGSNIVKESQ